MFKLLTEEARGKVREEYKMRRAIVMVSALILVLVIAIIGLLPSYVLSNARQNDILERTRISNESGLLEENMELRAWLVQTNNELRILSPKLDTDRPSEFISQILEQRTSGLRLTGFSWTKDSADNSVDLSIQGVAATRQSLISFESRIAASGNFSNVELPISNLAEDSDIDFQIRFSPVGAQTP